MNCETVQLQLLQLENLDPQWEPADVAEHIRACPVCAKKEHLLRDLEAAWRHSTITGDAERAKTSFLACSSEGE
jgi:hypothetical protein